MRGVWAHASPNVISIAKQARSAILTARKFSMFTPKTARQTAGFTLVELLTVIAIIAILMGILFPTIGSAIEAAKKTQAKNDALQIVNAIKGYYTEYGKYPSLDAATAPTTDTKITTASDNAKLIDILRSNTTTGSNTALVTAMNPRKIVFLEVPNAKNLGTAAKERAGIGSSGQYLDPWGTAKGFYYITFDTDYDNQVDNPYSSNAGSSKLSTGVIVWSLGRDAAGGAADKNAGTSKDDVISWQ